MKEGDRIGARSQKDDEMAELSRWRRTLTMLGGRGNLFFVNSFDAHGSPRRRAYSLQREIHSRARIRHVHAIVID